MAPSLMKDLTALLEAEMRRAATSARRSALKGGVGAIAASVVVLGTLLVATGVFLHLMESDGPLAAGLWVGGALIVIAVSVAAVTMSLAGRRAKLRAEANAAIARSIARADFAELAASAKVGGPGFLALAGVALISGIAAGRRRD